MKKMISTILLASLLGPLALADPPEQIIFAFQKQKDPAELKQDTAAVAEFLTRELGIPVQTLIPGSYAATVQAMLSNKADIAYLDSMPFLLARRDGGAQLLLAEQRMDLQGEKRTDYDSVFVVRKDSPLRDIDDLIENAGDTRLVYTSPTSTSGYIMANYRLVKEGLLEPRQDPREVFASVSFGGGYTQALEEVLRGRADVTAVSFYTVEGPRADVYLDPGELDQLRILARTPGVPTHVIATRDELSDELKHKIQTALLQLSEEKPELLADVYGASTFAKVDEQEHVGPVIEAIEYLGLPIENLAKDD